jgi:hypothetical protein
MALERDPPYLGDIGESEEPGFCYEPSHHHDCGCGADPDCWEEY